MAAKTIQIMYQTDEILVVNKPCGMSTQGGASSGVPLDKALEQQLGKKVYLVHRLDRDTAGLMIVSKTREAAAKWTHLVSSKEVKKEYIAVCFGVPSPEQGTITKPIAERARRGGQGRQGGQGEQGCLEGGKRMLPAITQYEVQCTGEVTMPLPPAVLSFVRARLLTGRLHQIRIHLASIGCPIVGDDKHGIFALNRALRKSCGIKHLCLASVRLVLPCCKAIEIPPPEHIAQLMMLSNMDILQT